MYDALHGFRGGRVTVTATLESNLDQHLAIISPEPLLQVFLDIRKAYDSLDREKCLELLIRYGVGPNLTRLIKSYW